jgi:hypothetical protein
MRRLVERLESIHGATDLHEMGNRAGDNAFAQLQRAVDFETLLAAAVRLNGDVTNVMDRGRRNLGPRYAKAIPSDLTRMAHQARQVAKELESAAKKAAAHAKTMRPS